MGKGQAERSPTGKQEDSWYQGAGSADSRLRGSSVRARSKEGLWYCPDL